MYGLTWDEERALYTVVGAFVVNWGFTESAVSQACHILLDAGGHRRHRSTPREFGRKLSFIRDCFKHYPQLASDKKFCSTLRAETKAVISHRDFLIHGVLTGYDRTEQTYRFTRLDPETNKYAQNTTHIALATLLEIDAAARKIAADWLKLVENLHVIRESPNGFQKPDGIRHVSVYERANSVYQTIKRFICRIARS
ncbi:MAG TPA: hypothetical protein VG819_09795 [Rhizomicrobium sp.]|jgi:hypothetical protein|nr:hypothetical protein [Rhizomicrobium sp.]